MAENSRRENVARPSPSPFSLKHMVLTTFFFGSETALIKFPFVYREEIVMSCLYPFFKNYTLQIKGKINYGQDSTTFAEACRRKTPRVFLCLELGAGTQ